MTAVQAVQSSPSTKYPLSHVAATESESSVHVTVAALLTDAVQVVHVSESSQVPAPQVSVHVSMAPAAPSVLLGVAVAHAETRESVADEQVYVAPVAAPVTAVHWVTPVAVKSSKSAATRVYEIASYAPLTAANSSVLPIV